LKNANGTVKKSDFPGCINYNKETRPTADFVDFNGDGLLDIAVTLHTTITKLALQNYIEIFINTGTKENPSFNSSNPVKVQADGQDISYKYMNFVFSDINKDSNPDLLLAVVDSNNINVTYYMALNISTTNSIILGQIQPLIYNSVPLKTDVCQLSYGNSACLAYYDTDNDGVKELYVNARKYQCYISKPCVYIVNGKTKLKTFDFKPAFMADNMYLNLPFEASKIELYTLNGKKVTSVMFDGLTQKGIINLNNISNGQYIINAASKSRKGIFKISVLK